MREHDADLSRASTDERPCDRSVFGAAFSEAAKPVSSCHVGLSLFAFVVFVFVAKELPTTAPTTRTRQAVRTLGLQARMRALVDSEPTVTLCHFSLLLG
jgi:hypothetical protein